MAQVLWTFLAAFALAMHYGESIPVDTNLVIASDTQNPDSSATTSPAKPTNPPKILSMHVTSDVEFRFARTLIHSVVENTAKTSQEVSFSVVLPQDAFITGFEMEIDGKKYRAYVKEKEEAKKTYDDAVQQGLGAAHVAYSARESNSFDVSVNIEPEKKVIFVLTYEELLTRSKGLYHNTVTISPGQIIPDMSVKMHIKEPRPITKLYLPKFSSDDKVTTVEDDPCANTNATWAICAIANPIAKKTDVSPTETIVEFTPTVEDQEKLAKEKGKGMTGQFKVMYDVERDPTGGEVLVKDGYFVHFFAPTDLQILPKHIVFVLDISGSMYGRRIEQLKEAMKTILASLQPDDYFNIIVFSTSVISWDLDDKEADLETDKAARYHYGFKSDEPEPEQQRPGREAVPAYPATKENIEKAIKRIEETNTDSSTNIFGALKQAIKTVKHHRERLEKDKDLKARKSIIMFLTDGEPNVGESRPEYIISGLSELNVNPQAPIYSLTFGEYGNIDFLKKLSVANSGLARIIYEGADADIQLKRFYHDISSPLLSDVTFKYLPSEVDLSSTTQINYHTYYRGGELVVAGRTTKEDVKEITGDVVATCTAAPQKHYPVKSLMYRPAIVRPWLPILRPMPLPMPMPIYKPRQPIVEKPTSSLERAWAYLTVKQLIDEWEAEKSKELKEDKVTVESTEVDTSAPQNKRKVTTEVAPSDNSKAKKRALELALRYSFVTKLTSLVVVKPKSSEATEAKRIVAGEGGAPGFVGGPAGGGARNLMAMPARMKTAKVGRGPMPAMAHPPMAPVHDKVKVAHEAATGSSTSSVQSTDDDDISSDDDPNAAGDPFDKLTMSDVKWVSQYDLSSGRIELEVSGRKKLYDILLPWLNPRLCKAKTTPPSCTAPGISSGKCRHITQCVMRAVTKSVKAFLPYQCHIGNYLAVCCNE